MLYKLLTMYKALLEEGIVLKAKEGESHVSDTIWCQ